MSETGSTRPEPSSSHRVIKAGVKKRRPPLACIQCYQRKLKCGREFPSCGRCLKAGNAGKCTYRGSSKEYGSGLGVLNDGNPGATGAMPLPLRTPVSFTETLEGNRPASNLHGKMTHLKGQEAMTKFYGYSYPLNFYQQVRRTFIAYMELLLNSASLRSFDHT